jgi:hypothetical protein
LQLQTNNEYHDMLFRRKRKSHSLIQKSNESERSKPDEKLPLGDWLSVERPKNSKSNSVDQRRA